MGVGLGVAGGGGVNSISCIANSNQLILVVTQIIAA
jgi:hypothetical protein